MDDPMNNEESPRRDFDEMSIASDFSIIPESFAGQEDSPLTETRSMASEGLRSEDLQPSLAAETSFGKVLFQSIQATYTADSDIAVSYVLTPSVTAKSTDRVALYRVGFASPQDYLCYRWAPTPSKDHTQNHLPLTVVFKASSLPKDAGEFFQFCYVTHESHIVGVSTPFQLQQMGSVGVNIVCGVDDGEDGMVMVCTNESILHDKVNKLSKENEQLQGDMSTQQQLVEEKQRELEDKLQQLSMCQHHLQALETKMKKESSEKCELMGRIGQVVEEKGHLEDRLKTLERSLTTSTAQMTELEGQLQAVTEEKNKLKEDLLEIRKHRQDQDLVLKKCREDLSEHRDELQAVRLKLEQTGTERDDAVKELEFWTSSAATDKSEMNSLAHKYSMVNEELINKIGELDQNKKISQELEERLANSVFQMTSTKEKLKDFEMKLSAAEEQKSIHEEREGVVNQDNHQLKATICQLKEKMEQLESVQESNQSGREAAERIAGDLSSRLQTAKAEYHTLALTNLRLAKKIKKLRQSINSQVEADMTSSVTSQASAWLQVEGMEEDAEDLEAAAGGDGMEVPASMIQSCSSAMTGTTCSSCSHTTQQLSDAVHRKMEDIVRELSQQINSLKMQLQARQEEQSPLAECAALEPRQSLERTPEPEPEPKEVQEEQQQQGEEQPVREEEQEQRQDDEPAVAQEEEAASVAQGSPDEQQVLYSNSFLPAPRTAPVFLPENERQVPVINQEANAANVRASAPSPTPSMYLYLPCGQVNGATAPAMIGSTPSNGASLVVSQAHMPTNQSMAGAVLPPPLQPETTPTAIQAAVMSQFSSQPMPGSQGHESDDDDFHSTSDNDDAVILNTPQEQQSTLYDCPLCNLSFQPGAITLLEEHINSHLEHVCPVCSMAFQRNNQKRFEEHVHAHFADEEGSDDQNPLDDPSGPWGPQFRAARLLEID
ncbi:tax1-binding protein 1 homolog isoform X2 [Homarus americanus]|uniref:tax1-binding protein 1 homolog isoform X2 n=1 Tax=Homarus americanus TaxID=6706 RepID=UPI001C43F8A3|nr:tax1-binding protein 1 homolog isoform X2 [Homarus americanus]XP_042242668.1 tax1-binding protein 1 homolog isoform X2 [Homarus americanus]XP_042242669.1 tax1-binding protein 1 homolog isoform X2 [Homarus americanus]